MRARQLTITAFGALLVSPCLQADYFAHEDLIRHPSPDAFSVCFDHSCTSVVTGSLSAGEWADVTASLNPAANSPGAERTVIAQVIAGIESIVGRYTGTSQDKGRNLPGFGQPGQMDCIDESTNTYTYLRMLEDAGLLRWHRVARRSTRFGLFVGMPHTTAVIEDTSNGVKYAIDSWFLDNGKAPPVVELDRWKSGWQPGER